MRSLVKSCRVWATERFAPSEEEIDFSEVSAPVRDFVAVSRSASFWKLVKPASWVFVACEMPRLSALSVVP